MHDIYLYEDCPVLRNKLGIKDQDKLDEAEADYVVYRLKELALNPLPGKYDIAHLLEMHRYIFQDIYEWAGKPGELNIYKEEPALGGLSVDYSDVSDIVKDSECILSNVRNKQWNKMDKQEKSKQFSEFLAHLWKVHCFREGNTRTVITFCCQYADEIGLNIARKLFETHSQYVRISLVAYNAVFADLGDLSKKEYLEKIVFDSLSG